MRKSWFVAIIPGMLAIALGVFIAVLFLVKILWAWTVPDLFPGAVEQGLIARNISWFAALKLAIFIAILASITGIKKEDK